MRIIDKIRLIDRIGRELQSRFDYRTIDNFLAEFGVSPAENVGVNSKWIYVKEALRGVPTDTVLRIAAELDLAIAGTPAAVLVAPENWRDTKLLRVFISHVSRNKQIATRLKEALAPLGIAGFVAHEDIQPTLEWQVQIERALHTMDAFIAVLTEGFSASNWTQQEAGFAYGRGTPVITFKMGQEDPTGFLAKQQALPRRGRNAEAIAAEIESILASNILTADRLAAAKASLTAEDDNIPF